ncbi:LacI family DNA-binding transcriptional regulator [Secundilactobacillus folii]|uniref:LacI family DNA-binding transcriptional regulator n=1 Tax=Secundilactobacillus folii TaxID=2678357 RepID=A0A7X2XX13_9LACO|nr:LacI family DNA-binding transcriptional regulator [Secundilactobacillus folii]MTV83169.1 LacI family DNA-binding transcriptional regulator [Secundilactobacillus folii]
MVVTIRDIARRAGVSVSTASRALNNHPRISLKTRQKIHAIADEMGYLPNYNAKTLTSGVSNAVGVVFPPGEMSTSANPFFVDLLMGINQELRSRNAVLSVAIANTAQELVANVASLISQGLIHNFILLYSRADDPVVALLKQQKVQYVLIGDPLEKGDWYVNNDNWLAGQKVGEYLLRKFNTKETLFIESQPELGFERKRREGFQTAMKTAGVHTETLRLPQQSQRHVDQAVAQYLGTRKTIDGIVTTDDLIGMMVHQILWQLGHTDVPLVSFNRNKSGRLAGEMVRFVELYPEQMGQAAVRVLFDADKRSEVVPFNIEK